MDMAELERIFFSKLNSMTDGEILELVENAEPCGLVNSHAEMYARNALEIEPIHKGLVMSSYSLGAFIASEKLYFSDEIVSQRKHMTLSGKRLFKSPRIMLDNIFDTASMDAVLIAA